MSNTGKKHAPEEICSLTTQLRQLCEDAAEQRDQRTDLIICITQVFISSHLSLVKNEFVVVEECSHPAFSLALWRHFCSKKDQNSQHVGSASCFRGVFKTQVCEEQQYIAREVVCLPHGCSLSERWNFREREANGDQKFTHVGPCTKENFRGGKKWSISLTSMPCLSGFTIKLTAGNVSMYSICAGCVLCVEKTSIESGTGR